MKKRLRMSLVIMLLLFAVPGAMAAEPDTDTGLMESTSWWFSEPETAAYFAAEASENTAAEQTILEGLRQKAAIIDISVYGLSLEEARVLYETVVNKSRDIYYINAMPDMSYYPSTGKAATILPHYMTPEQQTEFKQKVDEIVAEVDKNWSDFEKALYLNDYLATHCKYDMPTLKETDSEAPGFTPYQILINGTGVCQAYTMAYRVLLNEVGIENGTARSVSMNHVWTIAKLEGEWYHIDTTWNDPTTGAMTTESTAEPDRYGSAYHGYFALSDAAIGTIDYDLGRTGNHYDWVAIPSVECTSNAYDTWAGHTVKTPFVPLDGKWYYISGSGIMEAGEPTVLTSAVKCLNISDKWLTWGGNRYYTDCFAVMAAYHGKLIYSGAEAIYRFDIAAGTNEVLLRPDTSNGYIYGFTIEGDTLTYLLAQDPNTYAQWEYQDTLLDPFIRTEWGYSWYREGDTLSLRIDAENTGVIAAWYCEERLLGTLVLRDKDTIGEITIGEDLDTLKVFATDNEWKPCGSVLTPLAA